MAALLIGGACGGSTTPVGPSPMSSPAPQYLSLVGDWVEEGSHIALQYRDTGGTQIWYCDTQLRIREQTGGTFSGLAIVEGGAGDSGRHCTYTFPFIAQMAADGTITSFQASFVAGCTPLSEASVSGTATSAAIRVDLTDRATCPDYVRQPRDTDRTLTISVVHLR